MLHEIGIVVLFKQVGLVTTPSNNDALPSHGVKPTWGFHKVKLRKLRLGSTLPASNSKKG